MYHSFTLKRFSLLAAVVLCLFISAQGQDAWHNGIHYNVTGQNTGEVTYLDFYYDFWDYVGYYNYYSSYVGDIDIPSDLTAQVFLPYQEPYDVSLTVTGIGSYAFSNCYELTSVTLPNTIEYVSFYSFHECTSLTSITCLGMTPPAAYDDSDIESVFDQNTYETATLYVPMGALDAYKSADVWRNFKNIVAISGGDTIPGDVDGDGVLTVGDATDLMDLILNKASAEEYSVADVDGDGTISISDLVELVDMLFGE